MDKKYNLPTTVPENTLRMLKVVNLDMHSDDWGQNKTKQTGAELCQAQVKLVNKYFCQYFTYN